MDLKNNSGIDLIDIKTTNYMTGIILAGGKSSRMGFNKIDIKIGSIPLFIDQIFKLSFFCSEILISTTENNYKYLKDELARLNDYYKYFYKQCNLKRLPNIDIFKDEESQVKSDTDSYTDFKSKGPIYGIYNGLKHAQNFYSVILAFDMPFISFRLLNFLKLINNSLDKPADAFIMKTKKGFETLCSMYSKNCIEPIQKNIGSKNYKISDIFPSLNVRLILINELENFNQDINSVNNCGIDNLNFFNINTKEDYENFLTTWNNNNNSSIGISSSCNSDDRSSGGSTNYNFTKDFYKRWEYFFYR
jgi:molybdopterin-guanine dinucleotide biosynthesis protein A